MTIDLHTHSVESDGTDTPAAVMNAALAAGLTTVGLTDHDTVAGWDAAAAQVRRINGGGAERVDAGARCANAGPKLRLVRGAEFTCREGGVSVHMLGYLFDPTHPKIADHFTRQATARIDRAKEIVERLAADLPLTWEDVLAQLKGGAAGVVGRPHIADALVAKGLVADRSAAFASYLSAASPYYVPQRSPRPVDVVGWIVDAGGAAVLAHPKAPSRGKVLEDSVICELAEAGLFGCEIWHRDNPESVRPALEELVARLKLCPFGSSDYHGTGKPNLLGENCTPSEVLSELEKVGRLEVVV